MARAYHRCRTMCCGDYRLARGSARARQVGDRADAGGSPESVCGGREWELLLAHWRGAGWSTRQPRGEAVWPAGRSPLQPSTLRVILDGNSTAARRCGSAAKKRDSGGWKRAVGLRLGESGALVARTEGLANCARSQKSGGSRRIRCWPPSRMNVRLGVKLRRRQRARPSLRRGQFRGFSGRREIRNLSHAIAVRGQRRCQGFISSALATPGGGADVSVPTSVVNGLR
jgi:hypothetical protein